MEIRRQRQSQFLLASVKIISGAVIKTCSTNRKSFAPFSQVPGTLSSCREGELLCWLQQQVAVPVCLLPPAMN